MLGTSPNLIYPAIWCNVCFTLGLVGNGCLLVASVRHRALKMDKISVWILQNIAVFDILNCLAILLPVIIVQYQILQTDNPSEFYQAFSIYGHKKNNTPDMQNKTWLFGIKYGRDKGNLSTQPYEWESNHLCKAVAVFEYCFITGNGALMSLLSLNRLTRCVFPFRNTNPGRNQLAAITIFVTLMSAIPAVWSALTYNSGICYPEIYPDLYTCEFYHCKMPLPRWLVVLSIVMALILSAIPFTIILISNVYLVTFAILKSRTAIRRPGTFLCLGLTVGLAIACLPTILYCLPIYSESSYHLLDKIRFNLSFLSCWISPVLCMLTHQRFRVWVVTLQLLMCNRKKEIIKRVMYNAELRGGRTMNETRHGEGMGEAAV